MAGPAQGSGPLPRLPPSSGTTWRKSSSGRDRLCGLSACPCFISSLFSASCSPVLCPEAGEGPGEGGQSPLPSWTDRDWPSAAFVVSLLLVEPRLCRFTKRASGSRALLPPPPGCAVAGGAQVAQGGFLLCGDSARWETWVEPEPLPLVGGPGCATCPQRPESQVDLPPWGWPRAVGPGAAVERPREGLHPCTPTSR